MKIAYIIIDCDGRDGTAVSMAHVMHRLAGRGHDITLLADNADGADLERVRWQRVQAVADPSVLRFSTFYRNCSRAVRRMPQVDVLHSAGGNTRGANVYQLHNVQPAKRTMLVEQGQFSGGGVLRTLARRAYYGVTARAERQLYRPEKNPRVGGVGRRVRFTPVSRGTARELGEHYGIGDEHIDVIPNGVDADRFRPDAAGEARDEVRATLGVRPGEFAMLFVGGEWRRKGLHHAIDALPHVVTPNHPGGPRLVVAGRDAAQYEFERQARQLGVLDRVSFAGFQIDTPAVYAAADAFVFPTYYEAFSLSTLEAAASGLPIVTAETNGTEELIRRGRTNELGENGALVDRDGRAIATILNQLAADDALRRRIGEAGRGLVLREYTWDAVADATERVYERIVDDARRDGYTTGG